jgi:hypothetical protein
MTMTTMDCVIVLAPMAALVAVMFVGFVFAHVRDVCEM